jgi:hypothetical protein
MASATGDVRDVAVALNEVRKLPTNAEALHPTNSPPNRRLSKQRVT